MSAGKAFEREMLKAFRDKYPDGYIERNPDKQYQKSPPDMMAMVGHASYLIECKSKLCKGRMKPWPFKNLKDHQFDHLWRWQQVAPYHHAFLALMYYDQNRGKNKLKRAWLIPIQWLEEFMRRHPRKSVHMDEIQRELPGYECVWVPGVGWELPEWV